MGKGGSTDLYNITVVSRDEATGTVVFKVEISYPDCDLPGADACFAMMILYDTINEIQWRKGPDGSLIPAPPLPLKEEMGTDEVCSSKWLCANAMRYIAALSVAPAAKKAELLTLTPTHPAWTASCVPGLPRFGTTAYGDQGEPDTSVEAAGPIVGRGPRLPIDVLAGFKVKNPRMAPYTALSVPLNTETSKAYVAVPFGFDMSDENVATKLIGVPVVYKSWGDDASVGVVVAVEKDAKGSLRATVYMDSGGAYGTSTCDVDGGLMGRAVLAGPPTRAPPLAFATTAVAATAAPAATSATAAPARKVAKTEDKPPAPAVSWEFMSDLRTKLDNAHSWTSYAAADAAKIEDAYQKFVAAKKKTQAVKDVALDATYRVNFEGMVQYRAGDKIKQRPIRRQPAE